MAVRRGSRARAGGGVGGLPASADPAAGRGALRWASAAYETPLGRLSSRWEISGGELRLSVRIPPGAVATVHVPTTDPSSVRESGEPVAGVVGRTGSALVCQVGSGQYSFTSAW
ncbi:alpha-L-rhamnosidase C-terminal domain-containing protein [Nonomuraea thailandensis]